MSSPACFSACAASVRLLADVFEQRLAEQLFQLADLQAHRRLGQRHFFGRATVGTVLANGTEDLQLAQRQAHQRLSHEAPFLSGSGIAPPVFSPFGTRAAALYKALLILRQIIIHFL